jgi:L-asparagine oxygenase
MAIDPSMEAVLSDDTRDILKNILIEMPAPLENVDLTLARLRQAFSVLPAELLSRIASFGRHVSSPGALYLRNLPVDPRLPPTPVDGAQSPLKDTFISESVLLGLTEIIGTPVAFRTEKSGSLIHDVVPVASGATTQTNQSSKVFLTFHNDLVFDESTRYDWANPDFIILICIRQDPGRIAKTYYADARRLLDALIPSVVATLREPLFRLNAPGGYVRNFADDAEILSEPISVVTGPAQSPEIRLAANGVRGLSPDADKALVDLAEACRSTSNEFELAPGDALLVNNRKGVHARSSFPARHDGTDRWLQRTYVRHEMWTIRGRVSAASPWVH